MLRWPDRQWWVPSICPRINHCLLCVIHSHQEALCSLGISTATALFMLLVIAQSIATISQCFKTDVEEMRKSCSSMVQVISFKLARTEEVQWAWQDIMGVLTEVGFNRPQLEPWDFFVSWLFFHPVWFMCLAVSTTLSVHYVRMLLLDPSSHLVISHVKPFLWVCCIGVVGLVHLLSVLTPMPIWGIFRFLDSLYFGASLSLTTIIPLVRLLVEIVSSFQVLYRDYLSFLLDYRIGLFWFKAYHKPGG